MQIALVKVSEPLLISAEGRNEAGFCLREVHLDEDASWGWNVEFSDEFWLVLEICTRTSDAGAGGHSTSVSSMDFKSCASVSIFIHLDFVEVTEFDVLLGLSYEAKVGFVS